MARLHHELLTSQGAAVRGYLMLTHGIFGSGGNWRSIARKVHRARPDLGCVLVDLRNHGKSDSPPPPHDLAACADDVGELAGELAGQGVRLVAGAGHSFGGKVMATLRQRRARHPGASQIAQWWMLDASPSARPLAFSEPHNSVRQVLETLESLPQRFASREAFEAALTAAGQPRALAQWLAQNLEPADEGLRSRLPLPAVRQMLESYYAADLWPSALDPAGGDLHVVVAERSSTLSIADRAALRVAPPHLRSHAIDADHWLHIEAPDAVVALLAEHLPRGDLA